MKAIEVNGVSKLFHVPHRHRKSNTVFHKVISSLRGERQAYTELWALDNVSFSVEKGETLGIIGKNGSGKTTLLMCIAGIIRPTEGTCRTAGRVTPFFELGVGFQYEITARENVYLYGSILGLRRSQVDRKFNEAVKFAELEGFMDMKLKDLSSGMRSRLGFSIAMMANPDILLLDEVFAVGDLQFRKKCFEKMEEYKEQGKTILFVSHSTNQVERICERSILISKGKLVMDDKSPKVIDKYFKLLKMKKDKTLEDDNGFKKKKR